MLYLCKGNEFKWLFMIKNIVFDLGGVITDINRDKALDAFRSLGVIDIDAYLDSYEQRGIFKDVETGKLNAYEFHKALCNLIGKEVGMEQVCNAWMAFVSGVQIEKLRYLTKLSEKYMLYLLSNTNPFIMLWADSFDFSEDACPISFYFDKMYCSYKIGYTKPDTRIFNYMIEDSNIKPEETLFIDDGEANIIAAEQLDFNTYQPANGELWCNKVSSLLKKLNRK